MVMVYVVCEFRYTEGAGLETRKMAVREEILEFAGRVEALMYPPCMADDLHGIDLS